RGAPMHEGYRFRLITDVERFPDFIAPVAFTGTVSAIDGHVRAKMDQPIPGAEVWDNELHRDRWRSSFRIRKPSHDRRSVVRPLSSGRYSSGSTCYPSPNAETIACRFTSGASWR